MVYARPDDTGGLTTNVCLRTREIEDAAADLAYLRALKDGSAPPGRISGQVLIALRDLSGRMKGIAAPAAGVAVKMVKDSVAEITITDRAGDFAFEPREAGRYTVSIDASDRYYSEDPEAMVELRDPRACAQVDRRVSRNGRIAGRVVDASGQPVQGLTIELITAGVRAAAARRDLPSRRTITDAAGRYELARLPSGRFLLGINIAGGRRPQVFHPGVANVIHATTVIVPDGEQATVTDLRLAPNVSYVPLSGVVIDANGLPADNARVFLKGAGEDDTILAEPATTDRSGRFVIAGLANVAYRVFAERPRSDGQIRRVDSTDPIAVTATKGSAPVRLLLRQRY
jgi:5-hydroxyisourate hydrolase-like protein (transthyretin family)